MEQMLQILKEAAGIEVYGESYYNIFADTTGEDKASAMLIGLARDERDHRAWLGLEYEKLAGIKMDRSDVKREITSKIFPPLSPNVESQKEALRFGVGIEERSITFYSENSKKATGSVKSLFGKLVDFERGHKKILEDALYYLEQEGSWYGYTAMTIEG